MISKKNGVIVTRPQHDKVTYYISSWAEDIILFCHDNGIDFFDLGSNQVTKEKFEGYLNKQKPRIVLLNGHGDNESICGHNDEKIVEIGQNERVLREKIVYALTCNSGAELGESAIENGTETFIGYNAPFSFLTNKNKECVPEEDELANIFKEPSNQVSLNLLKGNTAKESYEKSQAKYRELIRKYSTSNALPEWKDIRFWLYWNKVSQVILGNKEAKF